MKSVKEIQKQKQKQWSSYLFFETFPRMVAVLNVKNKLLNYMINSASNITPSSNLSLKTNLEPAKCRLFKC